MKKQDLISLKDISTDYFERYGFINVIININQLTYYILILLLLIIISCIKSIVYFIFHVFYI